MKPYDELSWWCQLLDPWFGPPWYAEIEDCDAWLVAVRREMAQQADDLVGDDQAGRGIPGQGGTADRCRHQAEEIIRHEYGPPTSNEDDNDEGDQPTPAGERPGRGSRPPIVDGIDAEQRETDWRSARQGLACRSGIYHKPSVWARYCSRSAARGRRPSGVSACQYSQPLTAVPPFACEAAPDTFS